MPVFYKRHMHLRRGAVLTSASRDGAVLSEAMRQLGVASVRGSSSKRGGAAMLGLADWINGGHDVVITPDGYALTNFHVVKPAGNYMQCGMADGELYDAVIVGVDPDPAMDWHKGVIAGVISMGTPQWIEAGLLVA